MLVSSDTNVFLTPTHTNTWESNLIQEAAPFYLNLNNPAQPLSFLPKESLLSDGFVLSGEVLDVELSVDNSEADALIEVLDDALDAQQPISYYPIQMDTIGEQIKLVLTSMLNAKDSERLDTNNVLTEQVLVEASPVNRPTVTPSAGEHITERKTIIALPDDASFINLEAIDINTDRPLQRTAASQRQPFITPIKNALTDALELTSEPIDTARQSEAPQPILDAISLDRLSATTEVELSQEPIKTQVQGTLYQPEPVSKKEALPPEQKHAQFATIARNTDAFELDNGVSFQESPLVKPGAEIALQLPKEVNPLRFSVGDALGSEAAALKEDVTIIEDQYNEAMIYKGDAQVKPVIDKGISSFIQTMAPKSTDSTSPSSGSTHTPVQPGQTGVSENAHSRLVASYVNLASSDKHNQKAQLHVHEKDIGSIRADLELNGQHSKITFVSDNVETRALLGSQIQHLKTAFEQANLNLSSADVDYQLMQQGKNNEGFGYPQDKPSEHYGRGGQKAADDSSDAPLKRRITSLIDTYV